MDNQVSPILSGVIDLIEEEVNRRVALRVSKSLEVISKLYDIPLDQLARDTADVEVRFCQGTLKSKKRCLKEPQENGFCKFHQSQVPVMKIQTVPTSNSHMNWNLAAPASCLNI
jgi:hypothetical protein